MSDGGFPCIAADADGRHKVQRGLATAIGQFKLNAEQHDESCRSHRTDKVRARPRNRSATPCPNC